MSDDVWEGVGMATKMEPYGEGQFCILIMMVVTQIITVHMTVLHRNIHTCMHTYTHAYKTGKF